jgi:cytosine permease
VPQEKTTNWFQMGIILWGINVCIPAFMVGGMVASMARLPNAIVAILLGSLILTVISIATGILGSRTRMSTAMSSKLTFGVYGNTLIAILLFIGG